MTPSRSVVLRASAILLTAFCSLLASPITSSAEGDLLGLRPGLWQFDITYQSLNGHQVLDGRDLMARVLASVDPVDLALDRANIALAQRGDGKTEADLERANFNHSNQMPVGGLPTDMRMRAEAAARENGANLGATASFFICLTPELVHLQTPILDVDNRCRPTSVSLSGRHVKFKFACGSESAMMSGRGEARRSLLGRILTQMDFDVHTQSGQHFAVHDDTQMKFISPECGKVKPPAA